MSNVRTFAILLGDTTKEQRNALADLVEELGETIMTGSNIRTRNRATSTSIFKFSHTYWMTYGLSYMKDVTTISYDEFMQKFTKPGLKNLYD